MSDTIEIRVPDIGDFSDVEIIEVHVSAGDSVKAEDPLITLESDKAAMEVPSPREGTVEKVLVSVGDRVSEGSPVVTLSGAISGTSDAGTGGGPPQEKTGGSQGTVALRAADFGGDAVGLGGQLLTGLLDKRNIYTYAIALRNQMRSHGSLKGIWINILIRNVKRGTRLQLTSILIERSPGCLVASARHRLHTHDNVPLPLQCPHQSQTDAGFTHAGVCPGHKISVDLHLVMLSSEIPHSAPVDQA